MSRTLADFVIPAREARAFVVPRGAHLRIHLVEDKQVGDCCFYNADDLREVFHVGQTWALNVLLGTGNAKSFRHFYSKPPRENVMLTVVEDTVRNHWGNMGGRCSRRLYELRDGDRTHRSCQENLAEALAPHGLSGDDIVDVFNVFMNVELRPDGSFTILAPTARKGDYIELRADMNILAAVSACPADRNATNDGRAKPLGITISVGE
ncbi:MAG TPA: urea carboxylase-associated family protein [Burkholderiales bacterium]|nr:urea carboxylase-associated family protein [Burkholderiales bacterium]